MRPTFARGRALKALLVLLLLLAVGAAAGYQWLRQQYQAPGPSAALARVRIGSGATLRSVLGNLQTAGLIRDRRLVEVWLRLQGIRAKVKAGEYEIPPHASPAQIIDLFQQGRVILEQLTVVEGATFDDFRAALDAHPRVQHTLRGRSDAEVMSILGHGAQHPEGMFFPDTYRFAADTTDASILALAYDAMQRALTQAWAHRRPDLPFDTPYQALILASIVEKEAALKSERARIAGVFVNRLRRGMRLQSDPTVIYGMGDRYDGTIHSRDLSRDTPYNSYTRDGLPPTPIALPGRESIEAAVQPQVSDELYFVATGRGDGAHHFSRTLEEHNRAVQQYVTRLREARATHAAAAGPGTR
ncbi:MAG: endolytic transglycosylase MltG [Proteobacteria bacterium]|nr:endolytic transglycosylase MltG [Pseudomonadota bacterium]